LLAPSGGRNRSGSEQGRGFGVELARVLRREKVRKEAKLPMSRAAHQHTPTQNEAIQTQSQQVAVPVQLPRPCPPFLVQSARLQILLRSSELNYYYTATKQEMIVFNMDITFPTAYRICLSADLGWWSHYHIIMVTAQMWGC
jgi:hypothetical protein